MSVNRDEPPPLDGEVLRWIGAAGPAAVGRWQGLLMPHVYKGGWIVQHGRGAWIEAAERLAVALAERDRELADAMKALGSAKESLEECDRFPFLRDHIGKLIAAYDARRTPPAPSTAPAEAAKGDAGRQSP